MSTNLEIAFGKIDDSGLTQDQKVRLKVEASKNAGVAEGIKLYNPCTDQFLMGFIGLTEASRSSETAPLAANQTPEETIECIVYRWPKTAKFGMFQIKASTNFEDFEKWLSGRILGHTETDYNAYFLPDPNNLSSRAKITSIGDLRERMKEVINEKSRKSGIFVSPNEDSPDKIPQEKELSLISSLSNNSNRGSIQHEFSDQVLKRDSYKCRFCGHANKQNLEAAHIFDVSKANRAKISDEDSYDMLLRRLGLLTAYSVDNGITLCRLCHRIFDMRLCSVNADGVIEVANAIDSSLDNDAVSHGKLLRGKNMFDIDDFKHMDCSKPALAARYEEFKTKGRKNSRKAKDFVCDLCNHRVKTKRGLDSHRKSGKCLKKQSGSSLSELHTNSPKKSSTTRQISKSRNS